VVDVAFERTLVGVDVDLGYDIEKVAYYTMGAVASIAPETPEIIVQVFNNGTLIAEFEVQTQAVLDLTEGLISEQEFIDKIDKKVQRE